MSSEVGRLQPLAAAVPRTVRNAVRDRLVIGALVLAVLPIVISSVPWAHAASEAWLDLRPWAHVTLEASLNLLWLGVAVAAFLQWALPGGRRRVHVSGVISLIFALALLFPVISANDDLADLELINDAATSQAIATIVKSSKQLHTPTILRDACPEIAPQFAFSLFLAPESVAEAASALSVVTPGGATGNHSPPLS